MSNNYNSELAKRGNVLAGYILRSCGFEILERNWQCEAGSIEFIARNENELHLVDVIVRENREEGFPRVEMSSTERERFENIVLAYAEMSKLVDVSVRFSQICIVVTGANSAMIRHNLGAYSVV